MSETKFVNIRVNQPFRIEQGNIAASTGYSWKVNYSNGIQLLNHDVIVTSDKPGASAREFWIFKANWPGHHLIELIRSRGWERHGDKTTITYQVNAQ